MASSSAENVLKSLECQICFQYFKPPIFLCQLGHSICSVCKEKLNKCPTCKSGFTQMRNYALETLIENFAVPCKNTGCDCTIQILKLEDHGTTCAFLAIQCPMEQCRIKYPRNKMLAHFKATHKGFLATSGQALTNTQQSLCFISRENELFQVMRCMDRGCIFWKVKCVNSVKVQKYKARIKIFVENAEHWAIEQPCLDASVNLSLLTSDDFVCVNNLKFKNYSFTVAISLY